MSRIYLVDFDGTISNKDTLDFVAEKFYPDDHASWENKLKTGEFKVADWLKAFEKRLDISKDLYDRTLLENIEIDESFKKFSENNKVTIVSGGFKYNIDLILGKYDIRDIEIFSNDITFISENKIKLSMKYMNEECAKCGMCKKKILEDYEKKFNEVIFIGDGYTDICVAGHAKIIYAKKGRYLERYMKKKGLAFTPFEKFSEIN